jgi:RimJ/RimL family protein N-acetyltransferase
MCSSSSYRARICGQSVSSARSASSWIAACCGPGTDYHPVVELLRTPRVVLRDWRQDDLPFFFDLYSRWEVMRWLGPEPRRAIADLAEARERLGRWQARHARLSAPQGLWALVPHTEQGGRAAAGPVGTVLLLPLEDAAGPAGEVEIGWHLHPEYQGRGLATEAAGTLLGAAALAGHQRVLALTDPDNAASQAVAGRLDMADEGLTGRWFGLTTRQYAWTAPSEPSRQPR